MSSLHLHHQHMSHCAHIYPQYNYPRPNLPTMTYADVINIPIDTDKEALFYIDLKSVLPF